MTRHASMISQIIGMVILLCHLSMGAHATQNQSQQPFSTNHPILPGHEFWKPFIPNPIDSSQGIIDSSSSPKASIKSAEISWNSSGFQWEGKNKNHSFSLTPLLNNTTPEAISSYICLGGTIQRTIEYNDIQAIEYYEVMNDGISLSWVINNRPKNFHLSENLSVGFKSNDSRKRFAYDSNGNIVLRDSNVSQGIKIGEVVAIDSIGQKSILNPILDDNRLTYIVDSQFLSKAQFPLCIDPVIEPERAVPQISITTNGNPQFTPKIVGNDDFFIAVWTDQQEDGTHRIWGTRIDGVGNALDPGGFLISADEGDNINPSIAVGFENVLVVWEEKSNKFNSRILGMLISKETGKKELPDPIVILDLELNQQFPDVAAIGREFLIVAQTEIQKGLKKEFDIVAQRLESTGRIPDISHTVLSSVEGNQTKPKILAKDVQYFISWEDVRDGKTSQLWGTTFVLGPLPESPQNIQLSDTNSSILNSQIFTTNNSVGAIFQMRGEGFGKYGIYIQDLDFIGNGNIPDPVTIQQDDQDRTNPTIESLGELYYASWEHKSIEGGFLKKDIQAMLLDSSYQDVMGSTIQVTNHERPQSRPAVGVAGDFLLTMWEDFRSGEDTDIYYRIGFVLPDFDIFLFLIDGRIASNSPSDQKDPSLALGEENAYIAWSEESFENGYDLHLLQIKADSQQPGQSKTRNIASNSGDQVQSALAVINQSVVMIWEDRQELTRSSLKGVHFKEDDFLTHDFEIEDVIRETGQHSSPSLIAGDVNLFLVYLSGNGVDQPTRVSAYYLDENLKRINNSSIPLSNSGNNVRNPQTAVIGGNFIFSFEEENEDGFWNIKVGMLPIRYVEQQDPIFFHQPQLENIQENSRISAGFDSVYLTWTEYSPNEEDDESEEDKLMHSLTFLKDETNQFKPANESSFNTITDSYPNRTYSINAINDNGAVFWTDLTSEEKQNLYVTRINHDGLITMDFGKSVVANDSQISEIVSAANGNDTLVAYLNKVPPGLGAVNYRSVNVENSPRLDIFGVIKGKKSEDIRIPIVEEISISDYDSKKFQSGQLSIQLDNVQPEDQLEIFSEDRIVRVIGNQLFHDEGSIGLFSGGKKGQGTLDIILSRASTPEVLQDLVAAIHYNYEDALILDAVTERTGTITLTDADGAISSPARYTFQIESQVGPPEIQSITPSRTINPGESVEIIADVAGARPMNFQWYKDNEKIQDATDTKLRINNFTLNDSGEYKLEVWNIAGREFSEVVNLEIVTVDLCVRWRSEIGKVYHIVGKVSVSDAQWSSVSPGIEATKEQSEFCLPLTSPFRLFEVREGPPSTFTILDPTEPVDLNISKKGEEICFSWAAIPGAQYVVESRRLSESNWTQLGDTRVFDNFVGQVCIDPIADNRIYRVLGPPISSSQPFTIPIKDFNVENGIINFEWEGEATRFYQIQYTQDLGAGWRNYTRSVEETNFDFFFEDTLEKFNNRSTFFRVLQLP